MTTMRLARRRGTNELPMRNQHRAWAQYMAASAP